MADVLIAQISFLQDNPYGEYVAGDALEIFFDSDGLNDPSVGNPGYHSGISVYKNGVEVTSGTDIPLTTGGVVSGLGRLLPIYIEKKLVNGLCFGTYWTEFPRFFMSFPWYVPLYWANSPTCAVNPSTCDLIIVGTPQVFNTTGPTTADGEIKITASSSNPIQYKLGSDFAYNDGSGHQSTGEFTGLLPGQYRIYLRDSKNCFANVQVTVVFSNDYGPYYRLEYDDPVGGVTRIDIAKRDYSGSVTEVKGAGLPVERSLKGEGSQDKFESILATKTTVNLTSETNFAFQTLYANSPEEFRIYTYKNSTLFGVYKALPQQYAEDYKAPPYYVSIIATCGLPNLKDYIFLQDDGQRFYSSMKAIELIAYILKKTKLELHIRVGINLYATDMDSDDDDDPLDQAYVDCDTYYIDKSDPTLDYVLSEILAPFGATILQEFGVWNIVRVEEKRAEYDYREFDENGVYVSNSSFDPICNVVPVGSTGYHFSDVDHHLTLCPGYGKIRLFYKLGLRENILENGDFSLTSVFDPVSNQHFYTVDTRGFQLVSPNYSLSSSWEATDQSNETDLSNIAWKLKGDDTSTGEAFVQSDTYTVKMGLANTLKISIRFKLPPPIAGGLTPKPISVPYQKVRIRVKYGTKYLLSDGSWSSDENFVVFYVTEFDKYLEQEIIATQPDSGAASGYDFEVRLYHSYIYHAEFSDYDDLRAKVTYDGERALPIGARTEYSQSLVSPLHYYELEESTATDDGFTVIRPDDFAVDNQVAWIFKKTVRKTFFLSNSFWIDSIKVAFLTNGTRPVDTIIREIPAETRNTAVLEKEVIHGSYQSLVTTIPQLDFGIGPLFPVGPTTATLSIITTNVLSADLLYAGYFRASDGTGYETWTRDGISEESSLHLILLQQIAAQYKKSWRRLTGSFYSQTTYFNFLNVLRIQNDNNRLYLPISPTIDDKNNRVRGEFLELIDITQGAGADGSNSSPFTSGFTSGFGKGFN